MIKNEVTQEYPRPQNYPATDPGSKDYKLVTAKNRRSPGSSTNRIL